MLKIKEFGQPNMVQKVVMKSTLKKQVKIMAGQLLHTAANIVEEKFLKNALVLEW